MSLPLESSNEDVVGILRLLNGPLCGCEYKLVMGATLIIAGEESALLGNQAVPQLPDNAIVVPISGGINFEILLNENSRDGFRVRVLDGIEESVHLWQDICEVGALKFAVRSAGEDWMPNVVDASIEKKKASKQKLLLRRTLIGAVALFLILASGLVSWMAFRDSKRVAEVASIVAGSSDQYRLAKGRDGTIYIFSESERGASWARQALAREGFAGTARVSTLQDEEERLGKLLQENYPAVFYHRLKLGNLLRPALMLSQERVHLEKAARQALTVSMLQWMPYAESVDVASWSDEFLDQQAKAGLDRLGVGYARNNNEGSITYSVQGGITDVELSRLQNFAKGFYRDFGERYVYFSIELKEDFLNDKSFRYGSRGYVKLAPKHWLFSTNFQDSK